MLSDDEKDGFWKWWGKEPVSEFHGVDAGHVERAFAAGIAYAQTWRPVATAPTDGTKIVALGYTEHGGDGRTRDTILRACITSYSADMSPPAYAVGWYFAAPGITDLFYPIAWLPLPPTEGK